jgi:hypothetical protein
MPTLRRGDTERTYFLRVTASPYSLDGIPLAEFRDGG